MVGVQHAKGYQDFTCYYNDEVFILVCLVNDSVPKSHPEGLLSRLVSKSVIYQQNIA